MEGGSAVWRDEGSCVCACPSFTSLLMKTVMKTDGDVSILKKDSNYYLASVSNDSLNAN